MPFVSRDQDGRIIAYADQATQGIAEEVEAADPEVLDYLGTRGNRRQPRAFLETSDTDVARVLEDLIDLLIDKNVILVTELPEEAQRKLFKRQKARERLRGQEQSLMIEQDGIL